MTFGARNIDRAPDVFTVKSMDWLEIMDYEKLTETEKINLIKILANGVRCIEDIAAESYGITGNVHRGIISWEDLCDGMAWKWNEAVRTLDELKNEDTSFISNDKVTLGKQQEVSNDGQN